MSSQLQIPLKARLRPTFFVVVPAEALAKDGPRLKVSRSRLLPDIPRGLTTLLERHPAEIEVCIYNPGTHVDAWLASHIAHCCVRQRLIGVHTDDLNAHPRTGLWIAMLTAMRLARDLGGQVYDPDAMRMVALHPAAGVLKVDGQVAVGKHITIPYSHTPSGKIWMTTKGMCKFGLPELEVRDLPPKSRWFWFILNGVAQRLVDHALETVAGDPDSDELRVATTLAIHTSLLMKAYGMPGNGGNPENSTEVGLSFMPGDFPNGFVRIGPPLPGVTLETWVETIGQRLIVVPGLPSPN